jgi:acyl-coenzyme A thioesterase 13
MDAPEGFGPSARSSAFLDLIGPVMQAGAGAELRLGLRADARHVNAKGSVHGAVLTALADVGLGYAAAGSQNPPIAMVTASLTTDFLGGAKRGQWLETRLEGCRIGRATVFAWGLITADGTPCARMSALFQRLES